MTLQALYQAKWEWPFYSCSLYDRDKQVVNTDMTLLEGWKDTTTPAHKYTREPTMRECLHRKAAKTQVATQTKFKHANRHIAHTQCPQMHNPCLHGFTYTHMHKIYTHTQATDASIPTLITFWFTEAASIVNSGMDFFCFHKIHKQFIHLLNANQCHSVDVEQISLTCSVKTDKVVIQAYIKLGEKLLLNCEKKYQGVRFIYTAGNSWLTQFWVLIRSKWNRRTWSKTP